MTNEEARRKSGRDMEESRRASGRAMRDDMRALAENNRLERTLPVLPVRGKQSAKRGSANWSGSAPPSGGGGGIDSPLTETPDTREYYDKSIIIPDGGYFAYLVRPVKQLTFTDKFGVEVKMILEPVDYPMPEVSP